MSTKWHAASARLRHIFASSGPRQVHSPWLYELYMNMRKKNSIPDIEVQQLREIRKQLSHDKYALSFDDPGSRGGQVKSTVSEVFCRTSKPLQQALAMGEMAAFCDGKTILELGTAFGTTTLAMRLAAPHSNIITVEGVPEIAAYARHTLSDQENIQLLIGRFDEVLPNLCEKKNQFGLVFIDGHHSRVPTMQYLNMLLPALSYKAIVIIDDIYYSEDMTLCWKELLQHEAFQVKLDFYHFGVLIRNTDLSPEILRLRL